MDVAIMVPGRQNVAIIDISSDSDDDGAVARRAAQDAKRAAKHAAARAAARAAAKRAAKVTRRGPRIEGREEYDAHCVFPNLVEMNPQQVKTLKDQVRKQKPRIPFYVCTMKAAHTLKGAKMYFTRKYSKAYISKNLELPAEVQVYTNKKRCAEVRMIMGKGKRAGAQITTKWQDVVEKTKMKKNDIMSFWFRRSSKGGLKLIAEKLM